MWGIETKEMEREDDERHELYCKLSRALIEEKKKELKAKEAEMKALEDKIKANAKYIGIMNEIDRLNNEIEDGIVRSRYLDIKVENLRNTVQNLNDKKETLTEEKKAYQMKNDENKKRKEAEENTERKKLISKLNKDKSQAILDLIANYELVMESNKEVEQKLTTETEDYDKLLKATLLL